MNKQLSIFDYFSIEPFKDKTDFIEKTVHQIRKDFALSGLKLDLPENQELKNYDELFSHLRPAIENLLQKEYPRLLSLLYQIDLTPETIHKAKIEQPDLTETELITALIINREFKKIVIRMYFRSKSMN
ncbi:MAG: hypothetical protein Q8908_16435 [Bacteroidota bacterium]|nr:hypothetical protein [Bacteroidota bacterium]